MSSLSEGRDERYVASVDSGKRTQYKVNALDQGHLYNAVMKGPGYMYSNEWRLN